MLLVPECIVRAVIMVHIKCYSVTEFIIELYELLAYYTCRKNMPYNG